MKKICSLLTAILFTLCMLTGCSFSKPNTFQIETEYTKHILLSDVEYQIFSDTLYYRGFDPFVNENENADFHNTYVKIAENVVHVQASDAAVLYLTQDGIVFGMGNLNQLVVSDNRYDRYEKSCCSQTADIFLLNLILCLQ